MKKLICFLFVLFVSALNAQTIEQKSLAVTVYNQNLGVIKDIRTADLKSGMNNLAITDVSQLIDPTSVHIKLKGEVIEQNFQYDLVGMEKVLQKYIDKNISLYGPNNELIEGTLLSSNGNQVVIQKKDGGLTLLPDLAKYRVSVDKLPEGLITKPTLLWQIKTPSSGKQDLEISYQTAGLNWHAEYVAVLNDKDTKTDLKAWVSIENNSGTSYKDAKLKLVAGNVNRITAPKYLQKSTNVMEMSSGMGDQFQEKSFFEYHLYDLQRPATINNNETKQISLFDASNISVLKRYFYKSGGYFNSGSSQNKVSVVVEFENKAQNNLGMSMPAGKVRLYKSDGGASEFVGEDMIDHTPKDEKVKLKIGEAFDVVAEETQLDNKKITDRIYESTYQIKLRNHKEEDITVDVEKNLGINWEVKETNYDYDRKDVSTITYKIPVKKDGESVLTLKVRYNY
jgi:hypothetical protein